MVPILIIFWLLGIVYNLFSPKNAISNTPYWSHVKTNTDLNLKYHWTTNDETPEFLKKHFDPYSFLIFETEPNIEFFNGFFTNFKVERTDGIFVQKIELNEDIDDIKAMPLYFFKFSSNEYEMIKDLKGFEIESKGSPDDFIISAFDGDDEWEIRLSV